MYMAQSTYFRSLSIIIHHTICRYRKLRAVIYSTIKLSLIEIFKNGISFVESTLNEAYYELT